MLHLLLPLIASARTTTFETDPMEYIKNHGIIHRTVACSGLIEHELNEFARPNEFPTSADVGRRWISSSAWKSERYAWGFQSRLDDFCGIFFNVASTEILGWRPHDAQALTMRFKIKEYKLDRENLLPIKNDLDFTQKYKNRINTYHENYEHSKGYVNEEFCLKYSENGYTKPSVCSKMKILTKWGKRENMFKDMNKKNPGWNYFIPEAKWNEVIIAPRPKNVMGFWTVSTNNLEPLWNAQDMFRRNFGIDIPVLMCDVGWSPKIVGRGTQIHCEEIWEVKKPKTKQNSAAFYPGVTILLILLPLTLL